MEYKAKPNQNIFDVAMDLYGSIEGVFDLLISNPTLSMTTQLVPGMLLEYHDYFVVQAGIVQRIRENKYTPANGERHVYFKESAYELIAVCGIPAEKRSSGFTVSGEGILEVDWGDNSDLQMIGLSSTPVEIMHYFDSESDSRRIKIYGDCTLTLLDWSTVGGDVLLVRPLVVDEFVSRSNGNTLKGLFLFENTVRIDLQGMTISDLSPIADMSLQELDLRNVRFTDVSVLDDYLDYIVANYGTRRDCTVYLTTEPTERGMQAIETIIHEEAWNEAGRWRFIINGTIYTTE